jgi:hypothetical protein
MHWTFVAMALLGQTEPGDGMCEAEPLQPTRLLRRLSLDLTNRIPTPAEAEAALQGVTPGMIDELLASEGFLEVMRAHHADLVWPNLDTVELVPESHMLYPNRFADGTVVYYSAVRSVLVRQVGETTLYSPCRNEPASYDADGNLVLEEVRMGDEVVAYTEGWVEVEPYWAPGTRIKVCALDALDAPVGRVCPGPRERYPFADSQCRGIRAFERFLEEPFEGSTISCNSAFAFLSPDCGCGPNLRNCATREVVRDIASQMLEQQLRIIDRVIRDGEPYERILTSNAIEWNGPVVHYLRNHAPLVLDVYQGEEADWSLPNLDYTDREWVSAPRTGRHAGILTSPGFLLRFATDRMRAHRYYNAFECSAFTPTGPLPSPFEPCSQNEDLTERCGCDSCHLTLEPLASHWGRFIENGFGELTEERFPTTADAAGCIPPIESAERLYRCLREYELQPTEQREPYRGLLNAYVFEDPADYGFIEGGPALRVEEATASGIVQRCLAERMWTEFMGREPTDAERSTVFPELLDAFERSGRDVKALVRAIVERDAYRRLP